MGFEMVETVAGEVDATLGVDTRGLGTEGGCEVNLAILGRAGGVDMDGGSEERRAADKQVGPGVAQNMDGAVFRVDAEIEQLVLVERRQGLAVPVGPRTLSRDLCVERLFEVQQVDDDTALGRLQVRVEVEAVVIGPGVKVGDDLVALVAEHGGVDLGTAMGDVG